MQGVLLKAPSRQFGNVLHHPEIYRRMAQVYHLPMAGFWEHQRNQSLAALHTFAQSHPDNGARMSWIMVFFFWDFVPNAESQPVLQAFAELYPEERSVCLQIRVRAHDQNASIHTPAGMSQVGAIVREACLEYCAAHQTIHPSNVEALQQMIFIPEDDMPPEPE
jgi:hypothetical protein